MLDEIDYILSQLQGRDFSAFSQDATLKRAFVRSLGIIGDSGVALISLGLVGIIINLPDWQRYFQDDHVRLTKFRRCRNYPPAAGPST